MAGQQRIVAEALGVVVAEHEWQAARKWARAGVAEALMFDRGEMDVVLRAPPGAVAKRDRLATQDRLVDRGSDAVLHDMEIMSRADLTLIVGAIIMAGKPVEMQDVK